MSQYTDYIKEAAQDFDEMDRYEEVSCIYAEHGRVEIWYEHGGKDITFSRDVMYNGEQFLAGDKISEPPTDSYYLELKRKWSPSQKPGILERLIAKIFG